MGYFFHFSSLYPAPHIELYMWTPSLISYLNFKAVLALPKTALSAQTHKIISFFWIVWSTLFVYLWLYCQFLSAYLVIILETEGPACHLKQEHPNFLSTLWETFTNFRKSDLNSWPNKKKFETTKEMCLWLPTLTQYGESLCITYYNWFIW